MEKDKAFVDRIQKYIIAEAQREFGYAGLAAADNFALINTGEGNITIEINVK